jgi:hypothetical protein
MSEFNKANGQVVSSFNDRLKAEYHVEWSLNKYITCTFSLSGSSASLGFSWLW